MAGMQVRFFGAPGLSVLALALKGGRLAKSTGSAPGAFEQRNPMLMQRKVLGAGRA